MISILSLWTISISSMRTPHSNFLPCWVSSANTMPSLISIGWSSDQMREITGWSYCASPRSEEHRSELQSPDHLLCRLLLEKKKFEAISRVVVPTFTALIVSYRHLIALALMSFCYV